MRINGVVSSLILKIFNHQIWDKVRNSFKNKKSFMARKDVDSKVIIINEHQWKCIHTAGAWKGILEKPVKQILNIVAHNQLMYYNGTITFIEVIINKEHHDSDASSCKAGHTEKIRKAINIQDIFLSTILCFQYWRSGSSHLPREPSSWKRDDGQKMIFCKTDGFTKCQIPPKTEIVMK